MGSRWPSCAAAIAPWSRADTSSPATSARPGAWRRAVLAVSRRWDLPSRTTTSAEPRRPLIALGPGQRGVVGLGNPLRALDERDVLTHAQPVAVRPMELAPGALELVCRTPEFGLQAMALATEFPCPSCRHPRSAPTCPSRSSRTWRSGAPLPRAGASRSRSGCRRPRYACRHGHHVASTDYCAQQWNVSVNGGRGSNPPPSNGMLSTALP